MKNSLPFLFPLLRSLSDTESDRAVRTRLNHTRTHTHASPGSSTNAACRG